ncbi:MAG: DUF1559 domain-containing protein [Planctomycetales bacterium]|nr:DUF1559 domain-containing protein [Planctomycetales bacterium]
MATRNQRLVIAICFCVVSFLVIMQMFAARENARKMASQNNLKQLALAVLNYESAYRKLPAETYLNPWKQPLHGVIGRMMSFMESSDWYSRAEFSLLWSSPLNHYLYCDSIPWCVRPGCDELYESAGWGSTHYACNPNVFLINQEVSLSKVSQGGGQSFLFGELAGNYRPWGYPWLARELRWPINSDKSSYGGWTNGAYFCLLNGKVQWMNNACAKEVIESLSGNGSEVADDRTETESPNFHFHRQTRYELSIIAEETALPQKGGPRIYIFSRTSDGKPEAVEFSGVFASNTDFEFDKLGREWPEIKVLRLANCDMDEELAKWIEPLHHLEVLQIRRLKLTPEVATTLRKLVSLKTLLGQFDQAIVRDLQAILPACEILAL